MSEDVYKRSLGIIQDAMKDVQQEIVINLEDGTSHVVYVTQSKSKDGTLEVGFSTPSDHRKEELYDHAEKCLKIMIEQELSKVKRHKSKLFGW